MAFRSPDDPMVRSPDEASSKLFNLCRQYEIRLGEAVHSVRPGSDLYFSPSNHDFWMVALLLSHFADSVHKGQRGFKVAELVGTDDVMLINDFPLSGLRQLLMDGYEVVAL